jgi:hypothetical protein
MTHTKGHGKAQQYMDVPAVTSIATVAAGGGTLAGSMAASGSEFTVSMSSTDSVGASTENKGTSISKGGCKLSPSFFLHIKPIQTCLIYKNRLNIALIQIFSWFLLAYIKYIAYICKRKPIKQ